MNLFKTLAMVGWLFFFTKPCYSTFITDQSYPSPSEKFYAYIQHYSSTTVENKSTLEILNKYHEVLSSTPLNGTFIIIGWKPKNDLLFVEKNNGEIIGYLIDKNGQAHLITVSHSDRTLAHQLKPLVQ